MEMAVPVNMDQIVIIVTSGIRIITNNNKQRKTK